MNVPHESSEHFHGALALSNAKTLTFVTATQCVPYVRANNHQFVCECVECGSLDSCYEEETPDWLRVDPVCWACVTGDESFRYGSAFRGGLAGTEGDS